MGVFHSLVSALFAFISFMAGLTKVLPDLNPTVHADMMKHCVEVLRGLKLLDVSPSAVMFSVGFMEMGGAVLTLVPKVRFSGRLLLNALVAVRIVALFVEGSAAWLSAAVLGSVNTLLLVAEVSHELKQLKPSKPPGKTE